MADIFSTVIIIVIHTPIWVWPLYALLLFLGLQRTRDSNIRLWRMLTLPCVVTLLAISNIIGGGLSVLPAMLLGFVIGGLAGWHIESDDAIRRLPDGRVWLRGEWWSFAQIVLVLVFRYVINVLPPFVPALYADPTWQFSTFLVWAALSGSFLGRTARKLRVYLRPRLETAG